MRMILAATLAIAPLAIAPVLAKDNQNVKRLNQAAVVFSEVMATPDKGIPEDLVARAHCIVIVPARRPRLSWLAQSTEKATYRAGVMAAGRRRARSSSRAVALASRLAALRPT